MLWDNEIAGSKYVKFANLDLIDKHDSGHYDKLIRQNPMVWQRES